MLPIDILHIIRSYLPVRQAHQYRIICRSLRYFYQFELERLYHSVDILKLVQDGDIMGVNYQVNENIIDLRKLPDVIKVTIKSGYAEILKRLINLIDNPIIIDRNSIFTLYDEGCHRFHKYLLSSTQESADYESGWWSATRHLNTIMEIYYYKNLFIIPYNPNIDMKHSSLFQDIMKFPTGYILEKYAAEFAIRHKSLEYLKFMISKGAPVSKDLFKLTIKNGNPQCFLQYLFDIGLTIKPMMALRLSIHHSEILKWLYQQGLITLTSQALFLAIEYDARVSFSWLLSLTLRVNPLDLLYMAAYHGRVLMIADILKHYEYVKSAFDFCSLIASSRGHILLLQALVVKGVQLSTEHLLRAADHGRTNIILYLLRKGIYHEEAFRLAIYTENVTNIRLLAPRKIKQEYLYQAIETGNLEVVETLIKKGANVCTDNYRALSLSYHLGYPIINDYLIGR